MLKKDDNCNKIQLLSFFVVFFGKMLQNKKEIKRQVILNLWNGLLERGF